MKKVVGILVLLWIIITVLVMYAYITNKKDSLIVIPPVDPGPLSSTPDQREKDGCKIGGCSGQVCSDKEGVITTCEFTEAYACFHTAICERQKDGTCGWTQTEELKTCLSNANNLIKAPIDK